ncbi:MAG: hypothetical protein JWN28_744 [Candidatus Saccharibacteria bacterium]|nr:hypothetical protein [Candidatus Saccharibacteria bacterium]
MKFISQDQIQYTKLALSLFDLEKPNIKTIETILEFGELIKKYATDDNAIIYDVTEYIYEQLRIINNEPGAFNNVEIRQELETRIRNNKA